MAALWPTHGRVMDGVSVNPGVWVARGTVAVPTRLNQPLERGEVVPALRWPFRVTVSPERESSRQLRLLSFRAALTSGYAPETAIWPQSHPPIALSDSGFGASLVFGGASPLNWGLPMQSDPR